VKPKKTGTVVVVAAAATLAFAFVLFRGVGVEAAYPIEKARMSFGRKVWTRVSGLWRGAESRAENVRLRREVASLAMVRSEFERLAAENARLRSALDYVAKAPGSWMAAGVLSEGGGAAGSGRTVRVDKGTLAGVREGAVVAVPDGLVGRVASVTTHTSEVLLITDPSLKVSCVVEGAPGVKGILCGGSDDLLVLRHLNSSSPLAERSRVLTSGIGGVFPAGVMVGTLLACDLGAGDSSKEGEVQPAVDFSTLEDVFIRREE
jgi:rod shape-determining protein MreC